MKIFIGLCGRNMDGYESSGRGEGRWACSLARCLAEAGHQITMAPDMEEASWGKCKNPHNVRLLQSHEKRFLNKEHFDIAIFTSWLTEQLEARFIHADKYLWGIMGWKSGVMVNGFFKDNEYVIRYLRDNLPMMPEGIEYKDRCMLLAQPFGNKVDDSKFSNKRIGWVAKEAFLNEMSMVNKEASRIHLLATIEACKRTGATLAIFSSYELDPRVSSVVEKWKLMDELRKLDNVIMYPKLSFAEYQIELRKCSVTVPVLFTGSTQEVILAGVVPFLYKDHMCSVHPWISGVAKDLTLDKVSRAQSEIDKVLTFSPEEITNRLVEFLTDECLYEQFLMRLRPMIIDHLDTQVLYQFDKIVKHKCKMDDIRR